MAPKRLECDECHYTADTKAQIRSHKHSIHSEVVSVLIDGESVPVSTALDGRLICPHASCATHEKGITLKNRGTLASHLRTQHKEEKVQEDEDDDVIEIPRPDTSIVGPSFSNESKYLSFLY